MEKREIKRYIFIAFLAVAVCVISQNFAVFVSFLSVVLGALKPLIMGLMIAYIFNIIMNFFEKHYFPKSSSKLVKKSRRPVCLAASFAITIAIIILIMYIVVPEIASAFGVLYDEIPPAFTKSKDFILGKLKEYPEIQEQISTVEFDWANIAEKASKLLTSGVAGILSSAVGIIGGLTSAVTNLVLGLIFAVYLLLRKDKLIKDSGRLRKLWFSDDTNRKLGRVLNTANETFRSFFIGQFVEAIILGTLCFIGMKILKLPYAAMSGTLVGVTAFIPIVGAFLGAGISAFIILTESPMQALIFIIFLLILQQFEGNIIYPKVVGGTVGLPSIWTLAAVTVGGGLFGVFGMILGVPLAATLYKLAFFKLEEKESELGITPPDDDEEKPQKPAKKSKKPAKASAKKK
ncbi:AI-2E family transporter [Ruminococcus sp.]|jgi:predicted PurR-regulated permease PerM|uniref:AI-2E family transporter n=1 Tax=Ruminococcus sp. TaxID=41978 RepID=UPI0025E1B6EB|nr:AI-2E family transporter [Ruminococcus sp.]MBR1430314.1 AI-2E family transporter [Ruminococcus sp.]